MYAFSCYAVPRACGCVKPSVKEEVKLPRGDQGSELGKGNWEEGGEGTGRGREGRRVQNIITCSTRMKCENVLMWHSPVHNE